MTDRAAQARQNRARYPLTTEMMDAIREHFPDARLIATDENGGRGTFWPTGVVPMLEKRKIA